MKRTLAACATVMLLTACSAVSASAASGPGLKKVHDPKHVTGTIQGHCTYRDNGPGCRCKT